MSFFFKSSKSKQPSSSALPQASRNIRSSDGPGSNIPTPNGAPPLAPGQRPKSPPLGASANGSINSALMEKTPNRSLDGGDPNYEKVAISMSPSPEQKNLRERADSDNRVGPPVSSDFTLILQAEVGALTCTTSRVASPWDPSDSLLTPPHILGRNAS